MDVNDVTVRLNEQMTTELYKQLGTASKKTIASTLLDNLIEMIMNETLLPNYTFPNENDMCAQLGVSRSSLREAYTALAAMGFIRRTKSGTTVNPMRQIVASIPLRYLLRHSDLDEIMEYRIMLETQIAYLAAKYADEMMISELSHILDEMRSNNGSDVSRLSQLDISFHFTIATASNNSLLKNTLVAVSNELERSSYSGYSLDPKTTISNSLDYHQQILEAISEHDQKKARRAMRNHVKDIYTVLMRNLLN
jgi:GntR family transcriptional repressor for pyruvate dehydrogenase complex